MANELKEITLMDFSGGVIKFKDIKEVNEDEKAYTLIDKNDDYMRIVKRHYILIGGNE